LLSAAYECASYGLPAPTFWLKVGWSKDEWQYSGDVHMDPTGSLLCYCRSSLAFEERMLKSLIELIDNKQVSVQMKSVKLQGD
jgi:hypothetical protein